MKFGPASKYIDTMLLLVDFKPIKFIYLALRLMLVMFSLMLKVKFMTDQNFLFLLRHVVVFVQTTSFIATAFLSILLTNVYSLIWQGVRAQLTRRLGLYKFCCRIWWTSVSWAVFPDSLSLSTCKALMSIHASAAECSLLQ